MCADAAAPGAFPLAFCRCLSRSECLQRLFPASGFSHLWHAGIPPRSGCRQSAQHMADHAHQRLARGMLALALRLLSPYGLRPTAFGLRAAHGLRSTHVCLSSSHGVATVVMKNWEPFVFGPALAELSVYGLSCLPKGENSSSNSPPQMLSPPLPVPVGSPPWIIWGVSLVQRCR